MKTLLRLIRHYWLLLISQSSYPTSRERMWSMFEMGKFEGRKETLKTLPIVQVQPAPLKQVSEPLHLAPGMWSKLYFEEHPEKRPVPFEEVIKSGKNGHVDAPQLASEVPSGQLINDDSWLNSKPQPKLEGDPTESMPAIVRLRHELHRKA